MGLLGDELAFGQALTAPEYESVMALGHRKEYPADTPILTEGDRTGHVVIVLRGWVTVSHITDRGATRLILGLRGPGELLGEMAALDQHPRSATVRALGTVEATVIGGDAFRRFLANHPRVSGLVIRQLAFRLRSADQERSALASLTVLQRLASRLTELALTAPTGPYAPSAPGPGPTGAVVHLAQDELAATVGATREAVAKALRLLRTQKIVRTGTRMVEILDPALLALLAEGHRD
ncbi:MULTISPECIES: Crp/Fnr family transcriptional regulator [Streptomyces]|uniref:Crp/Fnr family transcriptional regulator n=1 Tax=Streptomyces TaxID=1883 RepID=UPI0002FB7386|nr:MULTISPECIES: Crp/Fnr family transcriptional regulator [Streptomyces]MCX4485775.1 Crp/Fnr family transcriptional regulator [Streptomyces anulatus]MCX4508673.1 Crp/Fnr family transcriptional regulator [Streptomyces anulatus]MCX4519444.1 Crp/Fnr family transcriptional regulator [Streptomyces anulatus]MCX4602325.1 Crp/Fnr family transcriptional regulator [Streptomyces anulatus]OKI49791.1 Crp/Fnr family transcriptional regulator [Streptomyces sp. CB00072]